MISMNETVSTPYKDALRVKSMPKALGATHTERNPFHTHVLDTSLDYVHTVVLDQVLENTRPTATKIPQKRIGGKSNKLPSKDLVQLPSTTANTKEVIKDLSKTMEDLSVEYPYVKDINKELIANFELILETMPALPCEVEERAVPLLPLHSLKRTLVLDLDETLIRTVNPIEFTGATEGAGPRLKFTTITADNGTVIDVPFYTRPFLKEFLETLASLYEIIIFSAGSKEYTENIATRLDPEHKYISTVLSRESCIQRDDVFYIKDLRILKDRKLEQLIIVDNMPFSFLSQFDNGIYIPSYDGKEDDNELYKIMKFLLTLKDANDVRPLVKAFAGVVRLFNMYTKNNEPGGLSLQEELEEIPAELEGLDIGDELE